jgi:hypothetical protein
MGKGATDALSEVETGNPPNRLFLQQKKTPKAFAHRGGQAKRAKETKMSSDLIRQRSSFPSV